MAIKDKIKSVLKKDDQPSSTSQSSSKSKAKAAPAPAPTSIEMPKKTNGHSTSTNDVKTPKTPQDEAIAFFSSGTDGQPVQVWELWLEDDGGPDANKEVCQVSLCDRVEP